MSDVSAVVRQVEEARRWIDAYDAVHPLTEHGSGHEIMGLMLDGEHAFLTTDHVRTLLDALSAAEEERDRRASYVEGLERACDTFEQSAAAAERREGELREALRDLRTLLVQGRSHPTRLVATQSFILIDFVDRALAAPAEPTEKEGGEG